MIDEFRVLRYTGSRLQVAEELCPQHDVQVLLAASGSRLRVLRLHQLLDGILPSAAARRQLHGAGPRALPG